MQEMNIAIAISDSYMMPATVMLHSLFSRTGRKIHIFLLYSGLSEKNRSILRKKVEKGGHRFTELPVDETLFKDASLNNNALYSIEIYYRILLPYITEVEKVLWLDSDIVITGDIAELYDIDVSKFYVAAVTDIVEENGGRDGIKKILGIEDQVYFSSGVMLINCKKIRVEIPQEAFFAAIDQYNQELRCPDQDILNLLLGRKMLLLDRRYNDQHHLEKRSTEDLASDVIIHYYWTKPWDKDYKGCLADLFWREARKSGYVFSWLRYQGRFQYSRGISFLRNRSRKLHKS